MEEVLKELVQIINKVVERQDDLEAKIKESQAPKEEEGKPSKEEIEYFKNSF